MITYCIQHNPPCIQNRKPAARENNVQQPRLFFLSSANREIISIGTVVDPLLKYQTFVRKKDSTVKREKKEREEEKKKTELSLQRAMLG